ncbi:MAG: T9SS type A sorting domain-containing protein [Rhodothermales bacterium]|nr:T9SS type A sorting domain-containing protein [Rhodothermales bacterium]MBO6780379.1 T9SS type A sorting domain-containing protein [Rhodothermales bacterium]
MKHALLLASALLLVIALPWEARTNSSGAPAGRSGGPPENGNTCNSSGCHFGSAVNSGGGSITVTGPKTYSPGQAVALQITVAQEGAQRIGFEVSAVEDAGGTHAGSWNLVDSGTRFASNNPAYVTHAGAPPGMSSRTFNVEWVPPSSSVGTVLLYIAGNAANGNGGATGDNIYTATYPLAESGTSIDQDPVPSHFALTGLFPNPARQQTSVSVHLPEAAAVRVRVLDMLGREVKALATGSLSAGAHDIALAVGALPAGTYLVSAETARGKLATRTLLVAR